MTREITADELDGLFILRRVPSELALEILCGCPVLELEKGDTLLEAGQSNQKLYIILSGSLAVHLENPESIPVASLKHGETVGELSVIDDSPATAYVVASESSCVLEVDESGFWDLVAASHDFACNMLMLLAERLRSSDDSISRNIRLSQRFEREALMDSLTGMKNRRWIDERLPRILHRHQRTDLPLSLVMFDVDHFKSFNDTYGHDAGDCVLTSVVTATAECLRPTDICARYGGEEFITILTGLPEDLAYVVAERVREAIAFNEVITEDGRQLPPVTVSLGVSQAHPGDDAVMLIKRADMAMYRAKSMGRNRTCRSDEPDSKESE
jgi:diguanylate cyclase (GGDEF)-like protein